MPDRIVHGLNGPRGSGLLAGSILAGAHAVAYIDVSSTVTLPSGLSAIGGAVPLVVYATAWAIAGTVAAFGAFRSRRGAQRDHADSWGHGLLAGMLYVWGSAYVLGWVVSTFQDEVSRQWIFGLLYLCVGMLVSTAARMTNPQSGGR